MHGERLEGMAHVGLRPGLIPGTDGAEQSRRADAPTLRHVVHVDRGHDHDRLFILWNKHFVSFRIASYRNCCLATGGE